MRLRRLPHALLDDQLLEVMARPAFDERTEVVGAEAEVTRRRRERYLDAMPLDAFQYVHDVQSGLTLVGTRPFDVRASHAGTP